MTSAEPFLQILQSHAITCVAFSPDSQTVATGSRDRTVRLWNVTSLDSDGRPAAQLLTVLSAHDDVVRTLSFSPDGGTLATGSWDKSVRLWEVQAAMKQLATHG